MELRLIFDNLRVNGCLMKKVVLIAFLLFTVARSGKTQTIISNDLLLWLYVGIENPVSVALKTTTPSSDIVVQCDNGTVKKVSNTKFLVKICSPSLGATVLKVFNKNKLVETREIRVRRIPNPKLSTCNQDQELIFKSCQGVRGEIVDFYMEGIKCKVEKFTVTIKKNTGDTVIIKNSGAYYQPATYDAFEALNIGETVILTDFEVIVGCETEPRKLTSVLSSVYSGKKQEFGY